MTDKIKDIRKEMEGEDAEFFTPPNELKEKMGSGGIPEALVDKAQRQIENPTVDFLPFAKEYLNEIKKHFSALKNAKTEKEQYQEMQNLIQRVMQIKAHGGMFKYKIMSDVANILLKFLDTVDAPNKDLYQIIDAHNDSIALIITQALQHDGSETGKQLVIELNNAIDRYYKKHEKNPSPPKYRDE